MHREEQGDERERVRGRRRAERDGEAARAAPCVHGLEELHRLGE
jgi:hypothetical protein